MRNAKRWFTTLPMKPEYKLSKKKFMQEQKMISRLGSWEHADAAILEIFGILAKYNLWDSVDACKALFRIAAAALPEWVSQNHAKILSGFWEAPVEESEKASMRQNPSRDL